MTMPGFIRRAFLIQSARCFASFGNSPAAIVLREATWVRFGPLGLLIIGLLLIVWQPPHPPTASHACAFDGSPCASSWSSKVSPAGTGVVGMMCFGIFSGGK